MKLINSFFSIMIILFAHLGNSQILDPASWEYGSIRDNIDEIQEITIKVILDESWYIYFNDQDPNVGPKPTVVTFDLHPSYELLGKLKPLKVKEKYDEVWMNNIRYIDENGGGFVQKIRVLKSNPVIRGTIEYSVCSMVTGQCVFPKEEFEIQVLTP